MKIVVLESSPNRKGASNTLAIRWQTHLSGELRRPAMRRMSLTWLICDFLLVPAAIQGITTENVC